MLCYSTETANITNNKVINCDIGFYIQYISNLNVCCNTLTNCGSGFGISSSSNVLVKGNNITDTTYGGITIGASTNCMIKDNNCINSGLYGIYSSLNEDNIFSNNTCNNNIESGIKLLHCNFNELKNNTCKDNRFGMNLFSSTNITIYYNTLEHNIDYGITTQASNVTIFNNNFIDNNYNGNPEINSQAINEGNYSNHNIYIGFPVWYNDNLQLGNFWSDLAWFAGAFYVIDPGNQTDIYPLEFPV
jgi:parallel beta-helix repeat protein